VLESRSRGYSFLDSAATPGTAAVGVAFPSKNPIAAISVAAISSRLGPSRRVEVARIIQKQVRVICTMLQSLEPASADAGRKKAN
jgi:DNA-binding IclR family transcriptional regulator